MPQKRTKRHRTRRREQKHTRAAQKMHSDLVDIAACISYSSPAALHAAIRDPQRQVMWMATPKSTLLDDPDGLRMVSDWSFLKRHIKMPEMNIVILDLPGTATNPTGILLRAGREFSADEIHFITTQVLLRAARTHPGTPGEGEFVGQAKLDLSLAAGLGAEARRMGTNTFVDVCDNMIEEIATLDNC